MHYHAEVWVPEILGLERQLAEIMAPYEEGEDINGFWDWYQIGGRWTGSHDKSYDPEADPKNHETCEVCNGTGFRGDSLGQKARIDDPSYTCNGCGDFDRSGEKVKWTHGKLGPGKALKWATEWVRIASDVLPVGEVADDLTCYTMIVGDQVFLQKKWDGENFTETGFDGKVRAKLAELGVNSGYMVTVDYHS